MATILVHDKPTATSGDLPTVGSTAPDFRLTGADLSDVSLETFKGKKKIISLVPSLDTGVCATSALKFNERAAGMDDTVVLVVSADLPFAQKRFCEAECVDNVVTLSMVRGKAFAKDYGMLITEGPLEGLLARSVVVVDENDKVVHAQLVENLGAEPDYDAALASIR